MAYADDKSATRVSGSEARTRKPLGGCLAIDLLHALKDVESVHRIRAVSAFWFQPALKRNPQIYGRNSRFLPFISQTRSGFLRVHAEEDVKGL